MEEESFEAASSGSHSHSVLGEPVAEPAHSDAIEPVIGASSDQHAGFEAESAHNTPEENESTEFEGDRSASHNVDPLPPVDFRLFGLGGKKKKSDEEPPLAARGRNKTSS